MNNQLPNSNHQINPKFQSSNRKLLKFGKLVIVYWLLFGYCHLVIGYSNVYALNLDTLKVSFLSGDYKSAIQEGERIVADSMRSSQSDELYYLLGLSYLKDGNSLRASDIFEIIIKEFSNSSFKDKAALGLGDAYFLRGNFTQAKEEYLKLIKNKVSNKLLPAAYHRLAQCAFKQGNIAEGQNYLSKLKSEFPINLEAQTDPSVSSAFNFYSVQVGSFLSKANAQGLCHKLIKNGFEAYIEESVTQSKKIYRVRVGRLNSRPDALNLETKLSQAGYPTKIYP